jgi:hypothetical protein
VPVNRVAITMAFRICDIQSRTGLYDLYVTDKTPKDGGPKPDGSSTRSANGQNFSGIVTPLDTYLQLNANFRLPHTRMAYAPLSLLSVALK